MRILHAIFTRDFAGSENNCAQLSALQAAAGDEVRVVIKGKNPKQVARFRNVVGPGHLVVLPGWWPSLLDAWLIRRVLQGFSPDVVHTHLGRATRRVGKVARKMKIPHVASLHLNYEPKVYGGCDGLVCVAGWQVPTLKEYRGKYALVRNWVPEQRDVSAADVADIRRVVGAAGGDVRVIGSVGRVDQQKGYDVLVPAFRKAFPLGDEPVRLVIVGPSGNAWDTVNMAAVGDARIHVVGYQANVATWLAAFDGFVSSSRFEGLALVLLEAVGAKLPILVTDAPGNTELAGLQAPGLMDVVKAGDVDALAAGLKALDMKQRPVVYDLSALDRTTVAERVGALYREVMAA